MCSVGVDAARERAAKAREMGSTIGLANIVGKAQHRFVIAVVPLHRDLNDDIIFVTDKGNDLAEKRLFGAVEIMHIFENAAFIAQYGDLGLCRTIVG